MSLSPLEGYYLNLPDGHRELLIALRAWLHAHELPFTETYKWSTPVFDVDGRQVLYLYHNRKKRHSYIAFAAGKHLRHHLLRSDGQKVMRYITLDPSGDLPVDAIEDCLRQAVARIRATGKSWS